MDVALPHSLAIGAAFTASYDFVGIVVLEPAVLLRWYFLNMKKEDAHSGLFLQAEGGAYIGIEEGEAETWFAGGLRVGYRIPLGAMFFIEPYGRGGYPYIFGVGLTAGLRF